jgi:putative membrane protein
MKKYLLTFVFAAAFSPFAFAQDTTTVTEATQFVPMVANSDLFEIESGKLAQKMAQSDAVKTAASQIVTDHTKSSQELEAMTKAAGITFQKPTTLDAKHQQLLDQLSKVDQNGFDAAFSQAQVQAHQEAISIFKSYSSGGDQPELKQFAAKGVPVLEQHLQMFQQIKQ